MLGTPENPPLLARKSRAVRTREVRTISRKDHVQAAAVSDDYLYGLIDGESMFHVGIVPSAFNRLGWQVIYQFKVAQKPCRRTGLVSSSRATGLRRDLAKCESRRKRSDVE